MKTKISLKRISVATVTGSIVMLVLVPLLAGAAPSATPVGGNVDAKFYTVRINDGTKDTLQLNSNGFISNPSGDQVTIDDWFTVNQNMQVVGYSTGRYGIFNIWGGARIYRDDGLGVGRFFVDGEMSNSSATINNGALTVADNSGLLVKMGQLSFTPVPLDLWGWIKNTSTDTPMNGRVIVKDDDGFGIMPEANNAVNLHIASDGIISNPGGAHGGAVKIVDKLVVTTTDSFPYDGSIAFGSATTTASHAYAIAMGFGCTASGFASQCLGSDSTSVSRYSTAIGQYSNASGERSVAIGGGDTAAVGAIAIGGVASASQSGAVAIKGTASGIDAIAMGVSTASAREAVAIGNIAVASGINALAMGEDTTASGENSTAMGWSTEAINSGATAFGWNTSASGNISTAMGNNTSASGSSSFASGYYTTASGNYSTAMGYYSVASAQDSVAIGNYNNATAAWATAIGISNDATAQYATAIGYDNTANGQVAVAIGYTGTASGTASLATGYFTDATGLSSSSFGNNTLASGNMSTAMGYYTTAQAYGSLVIGKYNTISGTTNSWVDTEPAFVIGNGTGSSARSDAFTVYKNGNATLNGSLTTNNGSHGISAQGSTAAGYFNNTSMTGETVYIGYNNGVRDYSIYTNGAVNIQESGVPALYVQGEEALWFNGTQFSWGYGGTSNYFADKVGILTDAIDYDLEVNGTAGKTGGGSWSNSSDIRLKDIKGKYDKGLYAILKLNPVSFNYKKDNPKALPSDQEFIGFIAQEVQPIFPEAVSEDGDGYLSFNIHSINVAVINAIKELKAEKDADVAALKAETEALRAEVAELKAEMAELKSAFAN